MDAAGDLRHGAARDLAVVAAVGVLEHEPELVRVFPVAGHVIRCDDLADGRRQFIRAGVVRVYPPILAGDARQHFAFDGLARRVEPHRRARPCVDHRIRLGTHIEPALDGRRSRCVIKEYGERPHGCRCKRAVPMRNCKPRNQCHVLTAVTSAHKDESLWLVSYMPLAYLRQLDLPHARRLGRANYHTSPS